VSERANIRAVRTYLDEAKSDRLAIDLMVAAAAGDDLPTAVKRLEESLANLPPTKKAIKANYVWNDLVERTREMMELCVRDFKLLIKREAAG